MEKLPVAKKPADLRQAMLSKALPTSRAPEEASSPDRPAVDQSPERGAHYRPGREGKSNVTGYFPPAVKKQLRLLAAEHETTIQALLAEALNDLFAKNGKPEIAPRED
jgi:hypothetical protein